MKKQCILALSMVFMAYAARAETIRIGVNGLVCAFCVKGIEHSFKALPAVETVNVNLDTKLVTVTTKPKTTLDDAVITQTIADAGYTTTSVMRSKE